MANVIKHKRGSGSDPSASDLILGELAIRTDTGKLFTKMDSGAIAEIAGGGSDIVINTLSSSSATGGGSATFNGSAYRFTLSAPPNVSAAQLLVSINGVIQKPVAGTGQPSEGFSVDGTDIILGDAPATGSDFFILTFKSLGVSEPADNSVTSAKIVDGAIVNADINASAAIAGTKISPDFGSQAITTLGGITGGGLTSTSNITINNDSPSVTFNDTNSENDFRLTNSHGTFVLFDNDAGTTRVSCTSSGKVGIGTTSPSKTLHIHGDSGSTLPVYWIRGGSSVGGYLYSDGGGSGIVGGDGLLSNTGIYLVTDTRIDFRVNGSERMRIDSTGHLLVNTTSVGGGSYDQLSVAGGIKITDDTNSKLEIGRYNSSTNIAHSYIKIGSNSGSLRITNAADSADLFTINNDGKVGIGTTSPNEEFTLQDGDILVRSDVTTGSANSHGIGFSATATGGLAASISSHRENANEASALTFKTWNGSATGERMRVSAAGNVGIGTTNPGALLTLNQTIPELRIQSSNNNFGMGDELGRISLHGADSTSPGAGEVFRIKTESSSSIGADYTTRLYNRNGSGGGATEVSLGNGEGSIYLSTHTTGNSTPAVRMKVASDGKVGIGTTSPSDDLHIADSGASEVYVRLSNSTVPNGWSLGPRGSDGRFQIVQNGVRDSFFIDTSGNATVNSGNLVIGTAGKGIDFSAASNLSGSTSETLDDYEEGTYTATMSVTSGTLSTTNNTLSYVKIGDMCHITGRLYPQLSSSGSMGAFTFALPFAAKGSTTDDVEFEQGFILHTFRATEDTDSTNGANRSQRNFRIRASESVARMVARNNAGYGTFGSTNPHMLATFTYQTA